jgi:hypothetical protein
VKGIGLGQGNHYDNQSRPVIRTRFIATKGVLVADDKSKASAESKSPVQRTEQVRASCGHMTDFKIFDDRKDQRFREQRRAKTVGRPCSSCRQKANEERIAQADRAKQEKARRSEEAKAQKPLTEEKPQGGRRLPHGSNFNLTYDATKMEWSGSLTVPDKGTFTAVASGMNRILKLLDDLYWQSAGVKETT